MKLKRLVAIFLVMTMTIGAAPSLVFADENDGTPNETKVVESSEPEEKKTVKPAETKPAETKPAETTVKETEKQAETSAAETTKPETTEPASTSETEKETPETTEPSEPRENAPAETNVEKPAKAAKGDETEPDDKEDGRQEVNITGKSESYTYVPSGKSDNEELFRKYIERKISVSKSNTKNSAKRTAKAALSGNGLTGNDKKAYDALKAQIISVAEGTRSSTILTVSISDLGLQDGTVYTAEQFGVQSLVQDGHIIDEFKTILDAAIEVDWNKVIDALLADCPYELYWYKKNDSTQVSGIAFHCSGYSDRITVTWIPKEFEIYFPVAAPYSAGDYQTDPTEVIRANKAISNAAAVVSSAKNKSDYEKLVFYIDEICKRVSYDKVAAQSGNESTSDPWQLISVFDNDSNTNVVCEGYSKSFKYLCDLTAFEKDISCILVVGTLKAPSVTGPHMWNLVTMDDGKNYLVDVTHCDAGSGGDPTMMFLRGYSSGDVSGGYTCYLGSSPYLYIYDDSNHAFTPEQLTISNKDYKVGGTVVDSGTCGTNLTWKLNDSGVLTISGTGAMTDWTTPDNLPWKNYRYDIIKTVISDGVTTIGDRAFCGLQNVRSVEISESVKSIGYGAFQNCAITSIKLPGSITAIKGEAFYSCGQLKSLTIPESVESIGERAFALCVSLETVVIPEKVTSLGAGAFSDCSGLVSVILNRQAYSESAFPGIPTSKLHYYYKVTYTSASHGTVSGKTSTYASDIVDLTIEPAPGYELVKLTWSTETGTPVEMKPGTDGKYVMPDSNDDIFISAVFRFGTGYVLSGKSVFRSSASDAVVKFTANAEGTYYYVVDSRSQAPSAAGIKAAGSGVHGSGSAFGTTSISITGMSSGIQYCHIALFDGDDSSNVLTFEMPYDLYYFEDFESYPLNKYISGGALSPISQVHNGTGNSDQKVTKSITSGKMLSLSSSSGWASDQIVDLSGLLPSTGRYVFEGDVAATRSSTETSDWLLRFSFTNRSYSNEAGILFQNRGFVDADSESVMIKEGFTKDTWYHIKIEVFPGIGKYCVYINGEKSRIFDLPSGAVCLGITAGHGYTAYYDNLDFYADPDYAPEIKTWADLQTALNLGGTVKLTQDITAGTGDGPLVVTGTVKLDLNGYVIDRNLKTATSNGGVIFVDDNGNLTINDSRPDATHSPAIKYKDLTTGNDVVVKGGIITGGYAQGYAGGIRFYYSSGTMNGGTIVGNKATNDNDFENAGGVLLYCSDFTINGGTICGNEAVFNGGKTNNIAAGVSITNLQGRPCNLNVNSGTITSNYTNTTEACCIGGIYNHASSISVSGKAYIYGNMKNGKDNNVCAENNYNDSYSARVVRLSGKLTDGARIGVTTWRIPPYWYGPDTFTYGFSTHNPGENPSKYFSLDDETAIMVFDDATEAKVALKFTLTITTDGNGTVTLDPADTDIYYGLYPTLSVTPKTGYVFKEWQVISGKATIDKDNKIFVDAEDPNNPVTDIQIKAVFERKKHNVTFVDGAKTLSTVAVVDGEKVTRPSDPVKDGFRFLGWYSDPEFDHPFVFDTAIGKETTIYASFVQEFTVKVTNGTAGMDKAIAGETVTVKADAAPSGYVFDKWTNVTATVSFADATATETSFDMPAGNVEVKATYKIVSGNCGENGDNVTWKIDYTTGTLTISGTGNMNNWADTDSVPWYPVKESIKSVVISDGVTSIGDSAFNGYSGITGITIPGTVTSIGNLAFSGCTSLTEVSYSGTKEQWNNISLGSGNDSLANATMQFAKSDNTLSVRGKTAKVKYSKLRRKKQTLTVGKVITFTNRGQGTLTYVKVSGSKKISISKTTGKVTIKKKGLKKRKTYSVKVRVMASGNENYKASSWKTITFKIKVK